jgi:hypothetical protein
MFAKDGDEPGAGNTGAHRIRKGGDGACNSPNQPLAQIPSPKSNVTLAAALLRLAAAMDIKVACDDQKNVITFAKAPVPRGLDRWLHTELCKHKREVIAAIRADVAARRVDTESVS